MGKSWRLIISPPGTGAFNMALDESLLLSVASNSEASCLRLYSWNPPTLSLGYAQSIDDIDLDRLEEYGWGLVRRPTGGRAILHTDELTYSVCAPMDDPIVSGSLLESYQRISQALLSALTHLGIDAKADSVYPSASGKSTPESICFEVPSNYEITVSGKKLIGSAQARKNNGVLQHGSLPLFGDLARITKVLKYPDEENRSAAVERLLAHAGTVLSLTGISVSLEDAQQAFIHAFTTELDIDFIMSQPTFSEMQYANELVKNKFGTSEWNYRS
jgi:lipoate-protein ligase A